jgi:hypothetical protein
MNSKNIFAIKSSNGIYIKEGKYNEAYNEATVAFQ